jgi:CHAT domain-containing protein
MPFLSRALVVTSLILSGSSCTERNASERGPPKGFATNATPPPATERDAKLATAESVYLRGDFDSATALWHQLLPTLQADADSAREARVLTWLGLAAYRTGAYTRARDLGEQALAIKLYLADPGELARSYNALGLLAWSEGRLEDAASLFERASAASREAFDESGLAKAANNLALVHTELGRFPEARTGFLEARSAGERLGDARIEGGSLTNLGMLEVQLGDPAAAIEHLVKARERYRSIAYVTGEQNALGQLGTAYEALGELGPAMVAYDSSLVLAREQGLRQEEASSLELIADLYRKAGEYPRALRMYDEANRINDELGLEVEKGTNRRGAAEMQLAMGRADLARQYLEEALRIHRATGARMQELRDRLMLAELASRSGDLPAARVQLHQADVLAVVLGARTARVEVALTRAGVLERAGDPTHVLHTLRAARRDLLAGGYDTEWQAASLRARAHARLQRLDSAASAGREAVAAVERVRGSFRSGMLGSAVAAERSAPYSDLVDVLLRGGRVEEALAVADASRNRGLLEHLAASVDPATPVRPTVSALAEAEIQLRAIDTLVSRLDALEETPPGERDQPSRDLTGALSRQLVEAREAYEALLVRTAERDARGTALLGGREASGAEIRAALRSGEVLVEYFAGPQRLVVFVVTRRTIHSLTVEVTREELASQVRVARDLLGRPGTAPKEAEEVLAALHERLIAPLQQAGFLAGARRLVLVPHAALGYLPAAALRHPGTGRYLVEDYALLHLPSSAALGAVREVGDRRPVLSGRAAGFAPFPEELPAAVGEVRTFGRVMRDAETRYGRRATELHLRQALANGGVVHVATHGVMNPRNPMFSRVALAPGRGGSGDDGRLEVHELLGLQISAPLVFLSGCDTGIGAAWSTGFERGEDYATLAQAFLYAGARNVLATLWPIGDRGAAVFAERFYVHLERLPPPEALAAAQRDLLRSPDFGRPFHWAGYLLSGEGQLR